MDPITINLVPQTGYQIYSLVEQHADEPRNQVYVENIEGKLVYIEKVTHEFDRDGNDLYSLFTANNCYCGIRLKSGVCSDQEANVVVVQR